MKEMFCLGTFCQGDVLYMRRHFLGVLSPGMAKYPEMASEERQRYRLYKF